MILALSTNHGYNERGLLKLKDFIGKDMSIEDLATLSRQVNIWLVEPDDPEPNTIYVAHPAGF